MKKILFILLAGFSISVFKANAQVLKTTPTMCEQHPTAESLLLKSKKQKTLAWVLLAVGAGTMLTTYVIENSKVNNDPLVPYLFTLCNFWQNIFCSSLKRFAINGFKG